MRISIAKRAAQEHRHQHRHQVQHADPLVVQRIEPRADAASVRQVVVVVMGAGGSVGQVGQSGLAFALSAGSLALLVALAHPALAPYP